MSADLRIEFPSRGATYCYEEYGVYSYGVYPDHSVLAGQEKRSFVASFPTEAEAKAAYPEATAGGCGYAPPFIPDTPPDWFDPANAGESWDGDY